jgi:dihydrofolate reductase
VARSVYYAAMTLDGFIAEVDDTLEWLMGYDGPSYEGEDANPMKGSYDAFFEGIGALVMGSATYEFLLDLVAEGSEWPYMGTPSWVLTSRDLAVPDGEEVDVRIRNADVIRLYDDMAASAEPKDLWVVGGGNVASQFADAALLDEIIVTVVPVVLGEGKPLFDRRPPFGPMRLTRVVPRDTGMVELAYEIVR